MAWATTMWGVGRNGTVSPLTPRPTVFVSVRGLSHPLIVVMGQHGGVPMEWFAAHVEHILKTEKRPGGARGLHYFLYLFGDLFHNGVGHGGHEVLECVHCDIGHSLRQVLADRAGFYQRAL